MEQSRTGKAREIALDLPHPDRLFSTDGSSPFAPDYDCVTGMEQLIEIVCAAPDLGRHGGQVTLRFEQRAADVDTNKIVTAIRRYCSAHANDLDRQAQVKMREGIHTIYLSTVVLLVALVLFILATRAESIPPITQTLLSGGLIIVGWVVVWRPIELLLYDPWLLRRRARTLRNIAKMDVKVL